MYKILQAVGFVLILYGSLMSFYYIEALARLNFKMFVEVSIRIPPIIIAGFVCWTCSSLHNRLKNIQKRLETLEKNFHKYTNEAQSERKNEI